MKSLLLRLLTAVFACSLQNVSVAAERKTLTTFQVQEAKRSDQAISLDGVVEALRQTNISTQVAGSIVKLDVKAGDRVKAGQTLLRIDARAAQLAATASAAQVEAALAQLKVARREFERQQQLRQKEFISQAALERAQAQWEATQAQVKSLQAQTQQTQTQTEFFAIAAPYAGIVSEVAVSLGDMAMPGSMLATMYDPSALRISAAVPESLLQGLADRLDKVRYELPNLPGSPNEKKPLSVELLPAIDSATHTATIRLPLPDTQAGAAPGMFARVWLPGAAAPAGQTQDRFYIPRTSIVRRAEMSAVYVVDGQGQASLRQVRLGRIAGDLVEVLSGLHLGDKVAVDPQTAAASAH